VETSPKPDGSWEIITTATAAEVQAACNGASNKATNMGVGAAPGTYTFQIVDESGDVLAKGSVTFTPSSAVRLSCADEIVTFSVR
jgi:hypothetical protein